MGGVKPLVYRQEQLRQVTLVKSVNTTASIRTTYFHWFHKMSNVLSENLNSGRGTGGGVGVHPTSWKYSVWWWGWDNSTILS